MNNDALASAEAAAVQTLKYAYARGDLDLAECERRLGIVLGLHGLEERRVVLELGARWVDITSIGSTTTQYVCGHWEWPEVPTEPDPLGEPGWRFDPTTGERVYSSRWL